MLKFLVDESMGKRVYSFLLEKGFDVKFVTEIMPRAKDINILEFAEKEERILITNDKDFGELTFRRRRPSSGIILLRLKKDVPENRIKHISYVLDNFSDKLKSHFVVVREGIVRIRKLNK